METKKSFRNVAIRSLGSGDDIQFQGMLDLFSDVFDDARHYSSARPARQYREALLARDDIFMLVALADQTIVGALVAYELRKFEQERSEFYIYDLAVSERWRRRGIATALIDNLKVTARKKGGWVIYVQADYGDEPATAFYTKLGTREDVMHFDLSVD